MKLSIVATLYHSAPYIDEVQFNDNNIELEYYSYPSDGSFGEHKFFDGLSFVHHALVRSLGECSCVLG